MGGVAIYFLSPLRERIEEWGKWVTRSSVRKANLTTFAKTLRKNSTETERRLWRFLRAGRFNGLKFRRQEPIGNYILDFVCFEKKIVIELDGGQHSGPDGKEKDRIRDVWLQSQGFTVLRFWDNEVFTNTEGVLEKIREACEEYPPQPLP